MSEKKRPVIACIPAYNEEKAIAKISLSCKKYVDEVLVCDDGSTDMTGEIATAVGAYVIYQERRLGFDVSIKSLFEGARQLNAEIAITYDPSNLEDPAEIPKLIERIRVGDVDIVIGSSLENKDQITSGKETTLATIKPVIKTGLMAFSENGIERLINDFGDKSQNLETIMKSDKTLKITVVEIKNNIKLASETSAKGQVAQRERSPEKFINLFTRKPFMFLSLPGILAIFTAIGFGSLALQQFLSTTYLSTNYIVLSSVCAIIGFVLITTSVILWFLPIRIKEIT